MPFVNEVVSDADIEAYGLPFRKGMGRWWTRDRERDLYLWGGRGGNPEWGEEEMGRFHVFIAGRSLEVGLTLGEWSKDWNEKPYVIHWDEIDWIIPSDPIKPVDEKTIDLIKEALICFGRDGRDNVHIPDRIVRFGF